jgi:hypothetical protein
MSQNNAGCASQVEIIRDGQNVHFVVTCASDYDAMMLYDRMGEEMAAGYVKLEIQTRPRGGQVSG